MNKRTQIKNNLGLVRNYASSASITLSVALGMQRDTDHSESGYIQEEGQKKGSFFTPLVSQEPEATAPALSSELS